MNYEVLFVVVFSVAVILLSRPLTRWLSGATKRARLIDEGVAAPATVVSIEQTGMMVNDQPRCRIRLRVEPADGPGFVATATQVVLLTEIPQYQPGVRVTVRYDPHDPQDIAIEGVGEVSPTEADALIAAYESLSQQVHSLETASTAEAVVTAFKPLVNINGNNPLATVEMKVLPDGQPRFDGRITSVFSADGLHKYQPGSTVFVRFDPTNRQRVVFDRDRTRTVRSG